jgi:hypothetical protein
MRWTRLPKGIMKSEEAVAETIENNVRKLIINESPVDPAYYEKMSKLLDALIEQRRKGVVSYKEYLDKIAALTKEATTPGGKTGGIRKSVDTAAQAGAVQQPGQGRGAGVGGGQGDPIREHGRLARQHDEDQAGATGWRSAVLDGCEKAPRVQETDNSDRTWRAMITLEAETTSDLDPGEAPE